MPENASARRKRHTSANLKPRISNNTERDPCAGTVSIASILRERNEATVLYGVNCPQKGENCARQKRKICFHIAMQSTVLLPTLTVVRCPCCFARFHGKRELPRVKRLERRFAISGRYKDLRLTRFYGRPALSWSFHFSGFSTPNASLNSASVRYGAKRNFAFDTV